MMKETSSIASAPFASVAICTYNRSHWLRGTLAFASAQDYPRDRWELLVIDNNSSDDTRAVVESFGAAVKPPRYLLEARQGLSHARNRALSEACGDVIVFLDDDTEGEADWLSRLMEVYAQDTLAKIGVVGGEIVPGFPDGLPKWLEGQWEPLAYRTEMGPLPPKRLPMGANFSARLTLARAVGGFRTDLGRSGDTLAGSEDHDFIRRVRATGAETWFAPAARVVHLIPGNRLCFRYAMKHAFDSSRSRVIEKVAPSRAKAMGWMLSRLFIYSVQAPLYAAIALLCLLIGQPGRAKRLATRVSRAFGYVVESWRQLCLNLLPGRRSAS
jgi:glycosyltransferase involved in cell wall biosynthesis